MQKLAATSLAALLVAGQLAIPAASQAQESGARTATPIKHVVVIFGENISFDHYFGTYPYATNPNGEPRFVAANNTPAVNGFTSALLNSNPNFLNSAGNGAGAMNPFRLDRSEAATADQDHNYTPEQEAFHAGLMDSFPEYTGTPGPPPAGQTNNGLVMGYYDGNTVTALWNYAQRYAMNDNSFDTTFGPSSPGAINLISGQTNGVSDQINAGSKVVTDGGSTTLIGDADPVGDTCSTTTGAQVALSGQNIGDLLNSRGVTWGWFEGGFDLALTNANGTTGCARSTLSKVTNVAETDYIPHHEPFQYYASTANPKASASQLDANDWARRRPGKPSIRHQRLLHSRGSQQHAGGQFPEGPRLSGRACRILRSVGRAGFCGEHYQFPAAHAGVELHSGNYQLR